MVRGGIAKVGAIVMVGNVDVDVRIVSLLRFGSPMLVVRGIMVPTVRR